MRTAYRWTLGGAAGSLALAAAAFLFLSPARPTGTQSLPLVPLRQRTLHASITASGTVVALHEVRLSFPVAGTLAIMAVRQGEPVQQGQALAALDPTPLNASLLQAEAGVAMAQAKLDGLLHPSPRTVEEARLAQKEANSAYAQAQAAYQAGTTVLSRSEQAASVAQKEWALTQTQSPVGSIPALQAQAAYEAAQVNVESARLHLISLQSALNQAAYNVQAAGDRYSLTAQPPADSVAAARAVLQSAQAAQQAARYALQNGSLSAPFAGTVSATPVHVGELVGSGTPVVLLQTDALSAVVNVDETKIARLQMQDPATVTTSDLPGAVFSGRILRIAPAATVVDGVTSFPVRVGIAASNSGLRAGMDVRVRFHQTAHGALTIPNPYLLTHRHLRAVCLQQGSAARFLLVRTGLENGRYVQIEDRSLRPGETVLPPDQCKPAW